MKQLQETAPMQLYFAASHRKHGSLTDKIKFCIINISAVLFSCGGLAALSAAAAIPIYFIIIIGG